MKKIFYIIIIMVTLSAIGCNRDIEAQQLNETENRKLNDMENISISPEESSDKSSKSTSESEDNEFLVESASEPDDDEVLPEQIDITVTREGLEDVLVGTLAISTQFDYAIYILPGFIFVPLDGNDNIESTPTPNFIIHLYEVDPSTPIPADEVYEGTRCTFRRVDLGDKEIEAMINYPDTTEHEEGGLMLLLAMVDTIQAVK